MLTSGTFSNIYNYNVIKGYTSSIRYLNIAYTSNLGTVSISATNLPDFATSSTLINGDLLVSFGTGSSIYPLNTTFNTNITYTDGVDNIPYTSQLLIVNNIVSSTQIESILLNVPYDISYINLDNYNTVQHGNISYNLISPTNSNISIGTSSLTINYLTEPYDNTLFLNEAFHTQSIIYTTNNEYSTNLATHSFNILYDNSYAFYQTSNTIINTPYNPIGGFTFGLSSFYNTASQPYFNIWDISFPNQFGLIVNSGGTAYCYTPTMKSNIGQYSFTYSVTNYLYIIEGSGILNILDNPSYSITTLNNNTISSFGGQHLTYSLNNDYTPSGLTYTMLSMPSWMTQSNGILTGFPTASNVGGYSLQYRVSNQADSITVSRILSIMDNTLTEIAPVTTKYNIGGQYFSYGIINNYNTATGSITLNIINKPTWLNNDNGIISGTSTISSVGNNTVAYTITNGFRSFNRTLPINVIDNTITQINNLTNQTTYASNTYSLNLSNYYQSYTNSITIIPSPLPSFLTLNGYTVSGTPTQFNVGTYTIGYTVSNGFRELYDSYNLNVRLANISKNGTQSTTSSVVGLYHTGSFNMSIYSTSYATVSISTYSFPNWLNFNPSNKIYSGTPSATGSSIATVTLTNGLSDYLETLYFNTIEVLLTKIKYHDVEITSTIDFFEYVLKTNEYSTNFGTISIGTVSKPTWLNYYNSNHTVAGIPTASNIGMNIVTYSVSNGVKSLDDYLYIQVDEKIPTNIIPLPYDVKFKHINSISFNTTWKKPQFNTTINSMVIITDNPTASISYPTHINYIGNTDFNIAPYIPINETCTSTTPTGTSSKWKVIYNGVSTSITTIGLTPLTTYRVAVINYVGTEIANCYTTIYSVETNNIHDTNQIVFRVNSKNGKPLKDVIITIYDRYGNLVNVTTTDEYGQCNSGDLETETSYRIVAEKTGYVKYDRSAFYNRKDYVDYSNDIDNIMKWSGNNRTINQSKGEMFLKNKNTIDIFLIKS